MNNIRTFHAIALGESHKTRNIPCQDATISFEDHDNQIYIGTLSDGHGGKDYFKSNKGSQLLVEIAADSIKEFIGQSHSQSLFQSKFTSRNTITSGENPQSSPEQECQNEKDSNEALNQLFKAIISSWQKAILEDWSNSKPTKKEMLDYGVPEDRIIDYLKGKNLPVAYGCTLICFARTKNYWFTFQIGDGKIIAFDNEMNASEPLPADEQCMGNVTTSMCQENAFENFRYAYSRDFPPVLLIGSDGIDGYFSKLEDFAIEPLKNLYRSIIETFINKGLDDGLKELNDSLPVLSKRGVTQDDMSIAGWIDFRVKESLIKGIINNKKIIAEKKLIETELKLKKDQNELNEFENNIAQKSNEINKIKFKIENCMTQFEQSVNEVKSLEIRIKQQKIKQNSLQSEKNELVNKKQNFETGLENLLRLKEMKIRTIQTTEEEKVKSKSLIEELGMKISKFLGLN